MMMEFPELDQQIRKIETIFENARHFQSEADKSGLLNEAAITEMVSDLAKYSCVLCSGLMENALATIYGAYARDNASEAVANFVYESLRGINNPRSQKFYKTAEHFNSTWKESLKTFCTSSRENQGGMNRAEAINRIIDHRHRIVHGDNSDITLNEVERDLEKIKQVLDFIKEQCFPR